MKVSKEAIVGLWTALERFVGSDHLADHQAHLAQAEVLLAGLADRIELRCELEADWEDWPAPVVRIFPRSERWQPEAVRDALAAGDPAVQVAVERQGLLISTHCLLPGNAETIGDRLQAILGGVGVAAAGV